MRARASETGPSQRILISVSVTSVSRGVNLDDTLGGVSGCNDAFANGIEDDFRSIAGWRLLQRALSEPSERPGERRHGTRLPGGRDVSPAVLLPANFGLIGADGVVLAIADHRQLNLRNAYHCQKILGGAS